MNQQNQQPEKQKDRRYDPELLKKGLRCDLDQYEFLKECSRKGDEGIKKWNQWRKEHPAEDILLEGAELIQFYLKGAFLCKVITIDKSGRVYKFNKVIKEPNGAISNQNIDNTNIGNIYLHGAKLRRADLEVALFYDANLKAADISNAKLEAAEFWRTELQGTNLSRATVDGGTLIWECKVNRNTIFSGVPLEVARIDPATKQLLEYNIRCLNWEAWYKYKNWQNEEDERHIVIQKLMWFVRAFWSVSDYGISTKRIIYTFFGLAFIFALLYRLFPDFVMVYGQVGDIRGFWHALYFSVVTMTTLGFGDIAANPDSWAGQTLLMVQVILGYVLLGALVTRFAVLFTAGGPAGKFADDKGEKDGRKSRSKY